MFGRKTNLEIAKGMLSISYSVLVPLLLVGGLGYFLSKVFNNRFILFGFIFIAYLVSNFLMFKKLKKLNQSIDKIKNEKLIEEKNDLVEIKKEEIIK